MFDDRGSTTGTAAGVFVGAVGLYSIVQFFLLFMAAAAMGVGILVFLAVLCVYGVIKFLIRAAEFDEEWYRNVGLALFCTGVAAAAGYFIGVELGFSQVLADFIVNGEEASEMRSNSIIYPLITLFFGILLAGSYFLGLPITLWIFATDDFDEWWEMAWFPSLNFFILIVLMEAARLDLGPLQDEMPTLWEAFTQPFG